MERDVSARLSSAEGRRFALLVGGAFLLLSAIVYWRGHRVVPMVIGMLGGSLAAAGLMIPGHLGPVYRGWMAFGRALSKITTPIFMGVIYLVVFTPMGLVRRALGRNALLRPPGDTFWITRQPGAGRRSDLHRQF